MFINISMKSVFPRILVKLIVISPHVLFSIGGGVSVRTGFKLASPGDSRMREHCYQVQHGFSNENLTVLCVSNEFDIRICEVYTFINSIQILIKLNRLALRMLFAKRVFRPV